MEEMCCRAITAVGNNGKFTGADIATYPRAGVSSNASRALSRGVRQRILEKMRVVAYPLRTISNVGRKESTVRVDAKRD
jgi:hypothetical protein